MWWWIGSNYLPYFQEKETMHHITHPWWGCLISKNLMPKLHPQEITYVMLCTPLSMIEGFFCEMRQTAAAYNTTGDTLPVIPTPVANIIGVVPHTQPPSHLHGQSGQMMLTFLSTYGTTRYLLHRGWVGCYLNILFVSILDTYKGHF